MTIQNPIRFLIGPALATASLFVAPISLIVPAQQLVIASWVGFGFCYLWHWRGWAFGVALLIAVAFTWETALSSSQANWFYLCAAYLSVSLLLYLGLRSQTPPIKENFSKQEATIKTTQHSAELRQEADQVLIQTQTNEIQQLKEQIQQLVSWQYRAVEAEQNLEQAKTRLQDYKTALQDCLKQKEALEAKQVCLTLMNQEHQNSLANVPDKYLKLDQDYAELSQQFKKLQEEMADLQVCYIDVNNDLTSAEARCAELQVQKESEDYAPKDVLQAWREADRERRCSEGRYKQLREQFEEQTIALNKARQACFIAEEALAAEKIRQNEEKLEEAQRQIKNWSELTAKLEEYENTIAHMEEMLAIFSKESEFHSLIQ